MTCDARHYVGKRRAFTSAGRNRSTPCSSNPRALATGRAAEGWGPFIFGRGGENQTLAERRAVRSGPGHHRSAGLCELREHSADASQLGAIGAHVPRLTGDRINLDWPELATDQCLSVHGIARLINCARAHRAWHESQTPAALIARGTLPTNGDRPRSSNCPTPLRRGSPRSDNRHHRPVVALRRRLSFRQLIQRQLSVRQACDFRGDFAGLPETSCADARCCRRLPQAVAHQLDQRAHRWRYAGRTVEVAQNRDDLPMFLCQLEPRSRREFRCDGLAPVVQVDEVAFLVEGRTHWFMPTN